MIAASIASRGRGAWALPIALLVGAIALVASSAARAPRKAASPSERWKLSIIACVTKRRMSPETIGG